MKSVFRRAFTTTIPVMAGYIVLGIGFGLLLSSKGYGALWALVMSGIYREVIRYPGNCQLHFGGMSS